jgi:hypothetical protein
MFASVMPIMQVLPHALLRHFRPRVDRIWSGPHATQKHASGFGGVLWYREQFSLVLYNATNRGPQRMRIERDFQHFF